MTNPTEVHDNSTIADATAAKFENAQIAAAARAQLIIADGHVTKGNAASSTRAADSPEATVAVEVASMGLSPGIQMAQMGLGVLQDGCNTEDLGGLEIPVTSKGDGFKSIRTAPFKDLFALTDFGGANSDFAPKGVSADIAEVENWKKECDIQKTALYLAVPAQGRAVRQEASAKYKAVYQPDGPGGGGMKSQAFALNHSNPANGPKFVAPVETETV